jgi:uncharacterized protein
VAGGWHDIIVEVVGTIGRTPPLHVVTAKDRLLMSSMTRDRQVLPEHVPYLPEIIDRLVRRLDLLQIILFGSWARGDAGPDSDVDSLLVLASVPLDEKRNLTVAALDAVNDVPVSVDVVVTDPDEIARRGDLIGTVLRPALREGVVVYERARAHR